jgi:hypothetical protein
MPFSMIDTAATDPCESAGVWPVWLAAGGVEGLTLWCSGDPDLLLARDKRVQVFGSREALLTALTSPTTGLTPVTAVSLDPDTARLVVAADAATFDLDAAATWFAQPDREVSVPACDLALNAINMATDIGATAGDERLAALVASADLSPIVDVLTFGLTLLGDGSPYRDDPVAMVSAITPESAEAVAQLVQFASGHVEAA